MLSPSLGGEGRGGEGRGGGQKRDPLHVLVDVGFFGFVFVLFFIQDGHEKGRETLKHKKYVLPKSERTNDSQITEKLGK